MPSVAALEEQIFQREGFRVSFERLDSNRSALPGYDYRVMAPNGWRVSDWKAVRLAAYVPFFKSVTLFRGDGSALRSDIRLGNLRDGYYAAIYGGTEPHQTSLIPLRPRKKKGPSKN
jgi:hypothetical protein